MTSDVIIHAMKIALGVIVVIFAITLVIYGTLSPCGILKKEIARQVGKNDEQTMYVLFGGFIERGIDTLSPIQCLNGFYKVKTEGVDAALNSLVK